MPKFKQPRVGIKLDMTPMVDIAFLLLTFFMLTTQFKPADLPEAEVTLPQSHSDIKLPESDVMVVSVNKEGKIFLSVDQQKLKEKLFSAKIQQQWNDFDIKIKNQYGDPATMAKLVPTFPVDIKELGDMLIKARMFNPKLRTVIKGDKEAEYGPVLDVMDLLQKANIIRFNLLSDVEIDK